MKSHYNTTWYELGNAFITTFFVSIYEGFSLLSLQVPVDFNMNSDDSVCLGYKLVFFTLQHFKNSWGCCC